MATATLFVCIVSLTIAPLAFSFAFYPAPARGVSRNRATRSPHTTKESSAIGILSTESRTSVPKPPIHWTVPGFKVGWRDSDGNWHDEDGPRNRPPQNYWRQSADEREYEYNVRSTVKGLEGRCSARRPSLRRKVLGWWAPLLLSRRRIAFNDKPSDDGGEIEVPFMVDISRSSGRRFGPSNHYGMFDLKLADGEELDISATAGGNGCEKMISVRVEADEAIRRRSSGRWAKQSCNSAELHISQIMC